MSQSTAYAIHTNWAKWLLKLGTSLPSPPLISD